MKLLFMLMPQFFIMISLSLKLQPHHRRCLFFHLGGLFFFDPVSLNRWLLWILPLSRGFFKLLPQSICNNPPNQYLGVSRAYRRTQLSRHFLTVLTFEEEKNEQCLLHHLLFSLCICVHVQTKSSFCTSIVSVIRYTYVCRSRASLGERLDGSDEFPSP